ncbi:unnamed protein product, partial [Meganyctiphanes norvegica]
YVVLGQCRFAVDVVDKQRSMQTIVSMVTIHHGLYSYHRCRSVSSHDLQNSLYLHSVVLGQCRFAVVVVDKQRSMQTIVSMVTIHHGLYSYHQYRSVSSHGLQNSLYLHSVVLGQCRFAVDVVDKQRSIQTIVSMVTIHHGLYSYHQYRSVSSHGLQNSLYLHYVVLGQCRFAVDVVDKQRSMQTIVSMVTIHHGLYSYHQCSSVSS